MIVTDVFHFKDGRSVLNVVAEGNPRLIEAGRYDLRSDGRSIQQVSIQNEMLTRNRRGDGERSVSTAEKIDIPSGRPRRELVLVPVDEL
jgi:hypothetical protein